MFRHFSLAVAFLAGALRSGGGESKIYVNCVFGKSRSTTFVTAYLMVEHGWRAADALKHLKERRDVQLNPGFLQQIADLDYELEWRRHGGVGSTPAPASQKVADCEAGSRGGGGGEKDAVGRCRPVAMI